MDGKPDSPGNFLLIAFNEETNLLTCVLFPALSSPSTTMKAPRDAISDAKMVVVRRELWFASCLQSKMKSSHFLSTTFESSIKLKQNKRLSTDKIIMKDVFIVIGHQRKKVQDLSEPKKLRIRKSNNDARRRG